MGFLHALFLFFHFDSLFLATELVQKISFYLIVDWCKDGIFLTFKCSLLVFSLFYHMSHWPIYHICIGGFSNNI